MTRVSLFVHDLSRNPIVRAAPIAGALEEAGFEVEVLGLLVQHNEVYRPYRDAFSYQVRPSSLRPTEVLARTRDLARQATGDLFYAFKPLWTSFYPALLASGFGKRAPLLLDVEDEEFRFRRGSLLLTLALEPIRGWGQVSALKYKLLLHPLAQRAHGVSVVSTKLLERYGGEILLHGPSRTQAPPSRMVFESPDDGERSRFGIPWDAPVVGFAGVPHPHKGLETIVQALRQPSGSAYHLALAGPPSHPAFRRAKVELGDRCHMIGFIDHEQMPEFLSAVDVAPAMQQRNRVTEAQVPAKVLEAMAMSRVVVGSRVGDLPRLLEDGENGARGWIVDPGRADQLTKILARLREDPSEGRRRAHRAREFFEKEASIESNAKKVATLVEEAVSRFRNK